MRDEPNALPLFSWQPPECQIIPFPFAARIGRARHVAERIMAKRTQRETDYYVSTVDDHTRAAMVKLEANEPAILDAQRALWRLVNQECARLRLANGSTRARTQPDDCA